jgi:hypothetical protein
MRKHRRQTLKRTRRIEFTRYTRQITLTQGDPPPGLPRGELLEGGLIPDAPVNVLPISESLPRDGETPAVGAVDHPPQRRFLSRLAGLLRPGR